MTEIAEAQPTTVDTLAEAVEAAIIHKFTLGTSLGPDHEVYHRFAVSIAKKVMEIVTPVVERLERERDEASESATSEGFFAHEFGDDVVKLRREVKRLTAESARSYSQGVEDMREKAARTVRAYSDDLDELAGEIHALPLASATERHPLTASHNAPAPRDSHMTSEVRSLVKRYGAPAIAAEAARQAKEEGR